MPASAVFPPPYGFRVVYFTTAAIVPAAASMAVRLISVSRWPSCDGLELEFDRSLAAQPHRPPYIVLVPMTFVGCMVTHRGGHLATLVVVQWLRT